MYGGGNIGRGFIGELFSESGYDVTFIDVNKELVALLNQRRCYPVRILRDDGCTDIWVGPVSAVDGTVAEDVSDEIAGADIMATAVGADILPKIAPNIAAGLEKRFAAGDFSRLNIIVCENLLSAGEKLRALVRESLPAVQQGNLDSLVGFVDASIGRMVPVVTDELRAADPLMVGAEEYAELPVDAKGFRGPLPEIKNLRPAENFGYYARRKLFVHNMLHALAAYLGALSGHEYIWQCVEDRAIAGVLSQALSCIAPALEGEYGVPRAQTEQHGRELLARFANRALGDTVARVGRDTRRKLSRGDRLVGAALLCEKRGQPFDAIAMGIAAALLFKADPESLAVSLVTAASGVPAALSMYSGLPEDSALTEAAGRYYSSMKY